MAKSHNQKGKILFLEQMLRETGENRVVTMQEILTKLMEYGIRAERKSIYDDIEALRDFRNGCKIQKRKAGRLLSCRTDCAGEGKHIKESRRTEGRRAES